MKKLVASAFLTLLLGMISVCFADNSQDAPEAKSSFRLAVYPAANNMKISVNIKKAKNSKVNIRLLNQMGETLTVLNLGRDNESSTIRFDLNHLEDGIYRIEVSDGSKTEIKTVFLQTRPPLTTAYRSVCLN
ncbi:T9SS type A sorting domain-containing protein [Larkinella arboricola]|nr:T9SS type A sorting domain-containing protein [Larkinella arboricola]